MKPVVADRLSRSSPFDHVAGVSRSGRWLRSAQVYGLAVVLIFAVLAFGAVENWSEFSMAAGAAALCGLWLAEQLARGRLELRASPLMLPIVGYGLVIVAQLLLHTSAYEYATRRSLLTAITLGILFFVATQALVSSVHLRRFTLLLATFGFAVAVLAILQHFTSPNRIYWTVLPADAGQVFGPYVNRNHYAGFMEMVTPLALTPIFSSRTSRQQKAVLAFMAVVMGGSIFLSQSRGGALAFTAEAAFLGILALKRGRRRSAIYVSAAVLVICVLLGVWLTRGHAFERFEERDLSRLHIAADTVRMAKRHPVLGWGAGTFEAVYPEFRTYVSPYEVDHAHNDYLEAFAETGVVGCAMVAVFVVLLYLRTLRRSARRRAKLDARIAALAGCTGLLVHSFTDFNMHIPANAALFFVLAAVATARPERPESARDAETISHR